MARREHPVVGVGAVAALAQQLRSLRTAAKLTYREVSRSAGYSPATLSTAASGYALPTWEVTAAFARACGVDPELLRDAWQLADESSAAPEEVGADLKVEIPGQATSTVEFRVLGPISMSQGPEEIETLGTMKEKALLVILLLNANRFVSTAQIAQGLWDYAAPDTSRETVQAYISRLRRRLRGGTNGEVTVESGLSGRYRIVLDSELIDLVRFERLLSEARAARTASHNEQAVVLFQQALNEWSGEPLEDLDCTDLLRGERGALWEKRRAARIECIETQLSIGRYQDAIIACWQVLGHDPLDQQLIGLLMRALAHTGRPGEALSLYREARTRLRESLGLDTAPQLREIHRAILMNEPALGSDTVCTCATPP